LENIKEHTIRVTSGYYVESVWEIVGGVTVNVYGVKDETILTVGSQNYDGFIMCKEGII
jgi:hypothetical protein